MLLAQHDVPGSPAAGILPSREPAARTPRAQRGIGARRAAAPQGVPEGAGADTADSLKAWVREGRITFEQAPLLEQVKGGRVQVGVEFRLFARLPESAKMDPGGPQSRDLHAKLRAIARSLLPKEPRATRCEVEPFDAALRLRPETHWAPEVQLSLRVEHRAGYLRPIDGAGRQCATEIRKDLRALGAEPR